MCGIADAMSGQQTPTLFFAVRTRNGGCYLTGLATKDIAAWTKTSVTERPNKPPATRNSTTIVAKTYKMISKNLVYSTACGVPAFSRSLRIEGIMSLKSATRSRRGESAVFFSAKGHSYLVFTPADQAKRREFSTHVTRSGLIDGCFDPDAGNYWRAIPDGPLYRRLVKAVDVPANANRIRKIIARQ